MTEATGARDTIEEQSRPLPGDVTIRPQEFNDDPRTVELDNLLDPEFPRMTVEEYRHLIDSTPPGVNTLRIVAEKEGNIIAHAGVVQMFWTDNPTAYIAFLAVIPEQWQQGVGSNLYDRVLKSASEFKAARLYSHVREDREESQRFAEHREFERTGHITRLSRLDVHSPTFDGYDELEKRLQSEGIRITSLAELGADNEDVLHAVHRVEMSTDEDEPGSETFSVPYEHWIKFFLGQPGMAPEQVWLALDGDKFIGTTALLRQGGNGAWHQGLGVEREYRGRGIARLLKLQTIGWAAQNGVDFLYTGNDIDNPRMYDINVRLGYKPLPRSIEVVRKLEENQSADAA
jgi:RimJ/RimL family protein N-acetyltransferase